MDANDQLGGSGAYAVPAQKSRCSLRPTDQAPQCRPVGALFTGLRLGQLDHLLGYVVVGFIHLLLRFLLSSSLFCPFIHRALGCELNPRAWATPAAGAYLEKPHSQMEV